MGISCERNSSYSFVPIVLKLCMCFPHGMRMCMWIGHSCWISFCHFFGIVNLVIFHYEFVKVCRCFYATNENIHVLSMKFPHLFLRPEIIITFLWGWEWSGGQVRHRSPRNSGLVYSLSIHYFLMIHIHAKDVRYCLLKYIHSKNQ